MNIPNSLDNCLGGKMQCFYCGKNVEDNGVERQGHTFCNNLCRYSFEKLGDVSKSQSSVVETYVDKRVKLADSESFSNNKYIKLISPTILIVLIGILIYKGIPNYVEDKAFTVLWICICFVGFIASVAAKKQNKPHHPQTYVDKQGISKDNSKSVFDNNYLKIVFAVLTVLLIYRSISNYIDQKQTEALIKDLDKTMIQFDRNMDRFKMNKH